MKTVLEHMTSMSDTEISKDLDCVLDALPEHEHQVARDYRNARRKAKGFAPGKPGARNHKAVGKLPRRCVVCSKLMPKAKRANAKYCSAACRRNQGSESPSLRGSETLNRSRLYPDMGAEVAGPRIDLRAICSHRSDDAVCLPCYLKET